MEQEIGWISADEVRQRLERGEALNLVDVREPEEVALGMLPGAIHIPLGELPYRHEEIPQADEVIFVCRSGSRSGRACDYLRHLGYRGLKNMEGGMLDYGNP
ncbi:rhodanese-like domain-containing protein [Paenibacillus mesotrionivorans]|jgi:rhodanese-related sulfurtransferase|uniref:Rhodanese-like domain-containing protein n=1 Tax=Paenibacillus mesotrionivorans TaxID=3160968 RepID=A0ACC7P7D5_9BACL